MNQSQRFPTLSQAEEAPPTELCPLPVPVIQDTDIYELDESGHHYRHARLTAAAPRLLSALSALDRMSRGIDWCDSAEQARRWNEARNAIIDVTGIEL